MDGVIRVDARLSAHEAVCAERWLAIRKDMETVRALAERNMDYLMTAIRGLTRLILVCAGALIMGMAGLIVTLALRGHG